jgi:subtilisin family serine protease
VSERRHRVITADKALVFTTIHALNEFTLRHPGVLLHSIPLLPAGKVEASVRRLSSEHGGCHPSPAVPEPFISSFPTSHPPSSSSSADKHSAADTIDQQQQQQRSHSIDKEYPSKSLTVIVAALSPEELVTFVSELRAAAAASAASASFELPSIGRDLAIETEGATTVRVPDCRHTEAVVRLLSHRREVLWIERCSEIIPHNRFARGVCQSGSYGSTPIHDMGLTGEGEVIGISDTGLDMDSCYFFDPDYPLPPYNTINSKHRKVVTYISTYGDKIDDAEGHGTHVAGTAAGQSFNGYSGYKAYEGHAYGAKIAFADIGQTDKGSLSPPSNLGTGLFLPMYQAGARVFSSSWGT